MGRVITEEQNVIEETMSINLVEWIIRGINHSHSREKVKAGVVSSLLVSQGTSACKIISRLLVRLRFLNKVHGDQAIHHRTEITRIVHRTLTGDMFTHEVYMRIIQTSIRALVEPGQVKGFKGTIGEKEGGDNL